MAGAYPKPDEERIRRNKTNESGFAWTNLPARNGKPVPSMPEVKWSEKAIAKWEELWHTPQSTMWDEAGKNTVEKYIALYERFWSAFDTSGAVVNGMTQCEDRLGLSPKAMLQLRWRVIPDATESPKLAAVEPITKPKRVDPRKKA